MEDPTEESELGDEEEPSLHNLLTAINSQLPWRMENLEDIILCCHGEPGTSPRLENSEGVETRQDAGVVADGNSTIGGVSCCNYKSY